MSESWMPSNKDIEAAHDERFDMVFTQLEHGRDGNTATDDELEGLNDPIRRLIERAVLKGQIEALECWYDSDADDEIGAHLDWLRARRAALEEQR